MMKIKLGFSSCPNDTFIFDALVHHRIDHDFEFDITIADIKELNELALAGQLDVIKVSYHTYGYITNNYQVLDAGSALGKGVGPLLISKKPMSNQEINAARIAIPGKYTTANLLMSYAFPDAVNKEAMLFSEIEQAVLDEKVDLGVIIHENRFTYHEKGLHKQVDLGKYWEDQTGDAIPLGGIVIKRSLPSEIKAAFESKLAASVQYAFDHPEASHTYVRQFAQEMNDEIIQNHINLYVNDYSLSLKEEGKQAILGVLTHISSKNPSLALKKPFFLD